MNTQPLDQDERFHDLLADYLRRMDQGEQVDQAAFLSAHPEYATALAEYFDGASVIENMAGPRVGPVDAIATVHGQAEAETSSEGIREAMTAVNRQSTADSGEQIPESFGRYKILKALGQGAMGAVYLAQDTQLERPVALKIPKFTGAKTADLLARFYREARAAAKLRHPNICPVFDVGEIDGRHYITMAFIAGKPLSEFAQAKKRQPEKNVAVVIRKLALGLAEAHAHGIIHRDLKPANIMVDTKGEPVVMDFGLARREEGDDKHVTREGAILGTPAYMSPEQVAGDQSKIGPPADIYSLGVVMYELLTGKVPFGGSLMSILMQIASEQPQAPALHRPGLDGRLEAICLKMMAKKSADRYGTMNEVAQALGEYLKSPASDSSQASASVARNALRGVPSNASNAASGSALLGAPSDRPLPVARRLESGPKPDLLGSFTVVPGDLHAPLPTRIASEALRHRAQRLPPKTWLAIGSGIACFAILFAAVTLYIRLDKVDLKVVIDDPSLAVKFEGETVTFEHSGRTIRVRPGERKFIVEHDGLAAPTDQFVLNKEGKNILEVKIVDGRVVVTKNGHATLAKRDPEHRAPETGWHGWPKDAPPPAIAPFDAKQAKAHQEAWAKYLKVPVEYTNSIGMKFRLIPPGEFTMGSKPAEIAAALKLAGPDKHWQECIESEAPEHKVVLTQPTYFGVHEVTQAEYERVMGKNPSHFAPTGPGKDAVAGLKTSEFPVEMVSWNDATEFCAKLSEREELKPFYRRRGETVTMLEGVGYRLPTEAEWEFACRAGTTTKYWIGDGDDELRKAAWCGLNSRSRTHQVRELLGNPFGLYDIHGNVWEKVQDGWGSTYYGNFLERPAVDPLATSSPGSECVIRGGNWYHNYTDYHRSASRLTQGKSSRDNQVGFRASLTLDAVKAAIATANLKSSSANSLWHGWPKDAPPPAIAPFDAKQAKAHQEAWAAYLKVPVEYTNSIGMKFRLIPPGEFMMGAPEEADPLHHGDEKPAHRVRITRPFYLGACEVSLGQFRKFVSATSHKTEAELNARGSVGIDPKTGKSEHKSEYSWRNPGFEQDDNHPVVCVTWNDAIAFTAWLDESQKRRHMLPTEAQWEMACRAGTTSTYYFGNAAELSAKYENTADASLAKMPGMPGWCARWDDGFAFTAPIGRFLPNAYGLHDMLGNVIELCSDRFDATYYRSSPTDDPTGPDGPAVADRVWRGVHQLSQLAPSHNRFRTAQGYTEANLGFRVAIEIDWPNPGPTANAAPTSTGWHGWPKDAPPPAIAPFDAKQANAHQEAWAEYLKVPVEYTNSLGMTFRLIPPGEYWRGFSPEEMKSLVDEWNPQDKRASVVIPSASPRHKVILTKPMYAGVHEVTQRNYAAVVGANPSAFAKTGSDPRLVEKVAGVNTANFPVESVSWLDAADFCAKLSQLEKLASSYVRKGDSVAIIEGSGYRLPSEAEWEFACRAGSMTSFSNGDSDKGLPLVGRFGANSSGRPHAVGELQGNPFGLFDMHGNAWEWVQDWWEPGYRDEFTRQAAINPTNEVTSGSQRILRGGNWRGIAALSRSAFRDARDPSHRHHDYGFRVWLSVEGVRQSQTLSRTNEPATAPDASVDVPDREANGTVFPGFSALPLHLVKQTEKFTAVREELAILRKSSKQDYHIVILPKLGDYLPRPADYLRTLAAEWEQHAKERKLPFDAERLVIIVLAMNDQQLQIHFGPALKDGLGLDGPPVTKELLVPHFLPFARDGKMSEGLVSLLRGTEKWIGERDATATAERAAALWVLSLKGKVKTKEVATVKLVTRAEDLPRLPFQLLGLHIPGTENPETDVKDSDTIYLEGLLHLEEFGAGAALGEETAIRLGKLKSLKSISLNVPSIGDKEVASLSGLSNLESLALQSARVGDEGVRQLATLPRLQELELDSTQITDVALAHLAKCPMLRKLSVTETKVGDAGLAHLKGIDLVELHLGWTSITDEGLPAISGMKRLTFLGLNSSSISDKGLPALYACKSLRRISLIESKATEEGASALRSAIPGCKVDLKN